jgi:predicted nucleic acid-binding protein
MNHVGEESPNELESLFLKQGEGSSVLSSYSDEENFLRQLFCEQSDNQHLAHMIKQDVAEWDMKALDAFMEFSDFAAKQEEGILVPEVGEEVKTDPKKFPQVKIDEVILGYAANPEYEKLINDPATKTLRDLNAKIDVSADPYRLGQDAWNPARWRYVQGTAPCVRSVRTLETKQEQDAGTQPEVRPSTPESVSPVNEDESGTIDETPGDVPADGFHDELEVGKGKEIMSASFGEKSPSWHKGKKFSIGLAMLTALLTLDSTNMVKSASYVWNAVGINKQVGDGSDGYVAYSNYVLAQAEYNAVKSQFEKVESTLKGEELFDEVEKLRDARHHLKDAKEKFLKQVGERNNLSADAKHVVMAAAQNMDIPEKKVATPETRDGDFPHAGPETKTTAAPHEFDPDAKEKSKK